MAELTAYLKAEQLPFATLLPVEAGDLVTHLDHPDFRGKVVERVDGRCKVKVLAGWRGPMPMWPVGMPRDRLEVVG